MSLNETLEAVRLASRKLALLDTTKINEVLMAVADAAIENTEKILGANAFDLERMDISNPKSDEMKCDIDHSIPMFALISILFLDYAI